VDRFPLGRQKRSTYKWILPSVFFARPGEKDRQKKKSTMLPQAKAVFV